MTLCLAVICGVFAFALYANTLGHGYVVDDQTAIVKNSLTHQGLSAVPRIFTSAYRAGVDDRQDGLYRPLSLALFALQWQLAPSNPRLGHWVNVLLYSLTAMALFMVLASLFENRTVLIPFVATILFVTHPIHTEVVANIKSSDELLCLLFSLTGIWAAIRYARRDGLSYLGLSALAILLGMLSKETAVTMLAVVPMTVHFFTRANLRTLATATAAPGAALIAYLSLRVSALGALTRFEPIHVINNTLVAAGDDSAMRFATAASLVGRYLRLLVWPSPLCFDYSYNTIPLVTVNDPAALSSMAAILALGIIALFGFKTKHPVAWGILFMGVTLAPVSNTFVLIESTLAERFLYMPSVGFCVALACSIVLAVSPYAQRPLGMRWGEFTPTKAHVFVLSIVAILAALGSAKTYARNLDWESNLTLVSADVRTHPNSARIRHAYGSVLLWDHALKETDPEKRRSLLNDAASQLAEAVRIAPSHEEGWFDLGVAQRGLGDYRGAIGSFERAIGFSKGANVEHYIAAGVAYGEDGQYERAFQLLNRAIELDSRSSSAYNNLGLFYSRAGNSAMSIRMLTRAMELNPTDDGPPFNLGNTYRATGDVRAAMEFYRKAVGLNPSSEAAWLNLGNSYGELGDYANALDSFRRVLAINPSNENARHNAGVTYHMMGDRTNAELYLGRRR